MSYGEVKRKVLIIDSSDRTSGTDSDFTITDTGIIFPLDVNFTKVKVISAQIPYTWYNIVEDVNDEVGLVDGTTSEIVILTAGNYTGSTLATELQTQLNASATTRTYTVTFSETTFKFTITASGAATFTLEFTDINTGSLNVTDPAHLILGFTEANFTSALVSGTQTLVSTNPAGFITDTHLWICSNLVDGIDNGRIPWTASTPLNNMILECIPINACFGQIVSFCSCDGTPMIDVHNSEPMNDDEDRTSRSLRFALKLPSIDGQAEVSTVDTAGATPGTLGGTYFNLYSAGDTIQYYVWMDRNGDGTTEDPAPSGATGVQVDISASVDDIDVATAIESAVGALAAFSTSRVAEVVTITTTTNDVTTDITDGGTATGFTISTPPTQQGALTTLDLNGFSWSLKLLVEFL